MKKQTLTMIALMVLIGSLMGSAKAQSLSSGRLVANIPFAFSVGNQTLPAGEYIFSCVNKAEAQTILLIRSKDDRTSVMLQMLSRHGKVSETAKVIFHKYGDRYFFAQAWTSGERDGLEAPKSRDERNLTRELAGVKPQTKSVALAASR